MAKLKHKKSFDTCAHRGLGQYCHRCEAADKLEAAIEKGEIRRKVTVEDAVRILLAEEAAKNGIEKAVVQYELRKITKDTIKKYRAQVAHLREGGIKRY